MCLLLTAYAALSFGRKPEEEKELKITIPENLDYTGLLTDLFGDVYPLGRADFRAYHRHGQPV